MMIYTFLERDIKIINNKIKDNLLVGSVAPHHFERKNLFQETNEESSFCKTKSRQKTSFHEPLTWKFISNQHEVLVKLPRRENVLKVY